MTTEPLTYGVHSEVGKLRKVVVCSPGLAHQRRFALALASPWRYAPTLFPIPDSLLSHHQQHHPHQGQ
jgi:hypothetical protein